jgi:hypothetical protein
MKIFPSPISPTIRVNYALQYQTKQPFPHTKGD